MPDRAPAFRPPGVSERKAWARTPTLTDRRKRGRAGMVDRRRVLDEEPFCRLCLDSGRQVASDVVDHILNLAAGGTDERANKQALCNPCHDAKTRSERLAGRWSGR